MAKTYTPVGWQDGEITKQATVTIDGIEHEVIPAQITGATPVCAENLNRMDNAIKKLVDEGTTSKDIIIGTEADKTDDTKLIVDTSDDNVELGNIGSEVVDSLDGNETYKAPSVRAVKEKFKIKKIWEGTLYNDSEQITLTEPLEVGSVYIFTFMGFSGSYREQHIVTFMDYVHGMQFTILGLNTNNVLNSARARIYASEDNKTLTINSFNMAENTALKRIDKIL